jgi:outer membrane protein
VKNNLSVVLNFILIIAVGILFYLHFSGTGSGSNTSGKDTIPKLTFGIPKNLAGARVVYINIDSINHQYQAFVDLYNSEGGNFEAEYQKYQLRANNFQRRYQSLYGNNGADWKYSTDSAEKEEAFLKNEEKNLDFIEQKLSKIQEQAMEKNAIINNEVSTYFRQYSQEKGIDYILAIGQGSPVIYANDSLDVTNDVVQALNSEYSKKKSTLAPVK